MSNYASNINVNAYLSDRRRTQALISDMTYYSRLADAQSSSSSRSKNYDNNDAASIVSYASTTSLIKSKFRKFKNSNAVRSQIQQHS